MIDTCPSAIHDPIDPLSRTTLHPLPTPPIPRADSPPYLRRLDADLPLPCPPAAACLPLLSILPALAASARLRSSPGMASPGAAHDPHHVQHHAEVDPGA